MHDLSIIIVNYNVKHFIDQALSSVRKAKKDLDVQIIVVDNASVDGSVAHIQRRFPDVQIVENQQNVGFAKANNQGIRLARAPYILLLNPDTVIEEDTLIRCHAYMEAHPDTGALGVRMIDGSGRYLPESKRGFPTPRAALFKMVGISALFPKSAFFNPYYLGHIDEHQTAPVDVLSGAFMFLRKRVLDQVGLLDEDFFMYGEDIDLSYRIVQGGHTVTYFPQTTIIHHKGESTKKESFNYVRHFYKAMMIFARKHFRGDANGMIFLLSAGIYIRAALSLVARVVRRYGWSLLLWLVMFIGLVATTKFWAVFRYSDASYYRDAPILLNYIGYASIWVLTLFGIGAFSKRASLWKTWRGLFLGTLIILALYGLLDTHYRSSRAIILLGLFWNLITITILHVLRNKTLFDTWNIRADRMIKMAAVGSKAECEVVHRIMQTSRPNAQMVAHVSPHPTSDDFFATDISNLKKLVRLERIDEVIFCLKDVEVQRVMQTMSEVGDAVAYKLVGDDSLSIVGSKSKDRQGEWYGVDIAYAITKRSNRLTKRMVDIAASILFTILSPLLFLFQKQKRFYWPNVLDVLAGRRTWVGYDAADEKKHMLPVLKPSVLSIASSRRFTEPRASHKANRNYALTYSIWLDVECIWRHLTYLGQRPSKTEDHA